MSFTTKLVRIVNCSNNNDIYYNYSCLSTFAQIIQVITYNVVHYVNANKHLRF